MSAASPHLDERALIGRARRGDEGAYRALVERYRGELHAHAYRMLGSVHDAEDAMQDALLRAWRGVPRFDGRSALKSWLSRIVTNTCLDLIKKRPKKMLPIDHGPPGDAHDGPGVPLTESIWIEPYPDEALADGRAAPEARYEQRESVELAFVAALQHLPARQRAVLILREVLGYSANEVADTLETSAPAVNSALQRARKTIDETLPERSQAQTLRALGDDRVTEIVESYMEAWERGDVEAVTAMLAEDAAITMPPMASWFRGEGVEIFLREWAFSGRVYDLEGRRSVRVLLTSANGQPAIGTYACNDEAGAHLPTVLQVL
ncbi:MAG TPA: RNA polymerase subunit sigma-70, partial [Solirubrobacteraceae bacterium]|nr:RNA polymerase subunit sigma-70 [Solirubrobacteraceae bacterium]